MDFYVFLMGFGIGYLIIRDLKQQKEIQKLKKEIREDIIEVSIA